MIDPSRVLIDAARAAGVTVYDSLPADVVAAMPCVVLDELPDSGLWPDFHERTGFSYAGWASTASGARAVALAARRAWWSASRTQMTTRGGRLGFFREDVRPAKTDTGMSGVFRAVGTCTVSCRP